MPYYEDSTLFKNQLTRYANDTDRRFNGDIQQTTKNAVNVLYGDTSVMTDPQKISTGLGAYNLAIGSAIIANMQSTLNIMKDRATIENGVVTLSFKEINSKENAWVELRCSEETYNKVMNDYNNQMNKMIEHFPVLGAMAGGEKQWSESKEFKEMGEKFKITTKSGNKIFDMRTFSDALNLYIDPDFKLDDERKKEITELSNAMPEILDKVGKLTAYVTANNTLSPTLSRFKETITAEPRMNNMLDHLKGTVNMVYSETKSYNDKTLSVRTMGKLSDDMEKWDKNDIWINNDTKGRVNKEHGFGVFTIESLNYNIKGDNFVKHFNENNLSEQEKEWAEKNFNYMLLDTFGKEEINKNGKTAVMKNLKIGSEPLVPDGAELDDKSIAQYRNKFIAAALEGKEINADIPTKDGKTKTMPLAANVTVKDTELTGLDWLLDLLKRIIGMGRETSADKAEKANKTVAARSKMSFDDLVGGKNDKVNAAPDKSDEKAMQKNNEL